VNDGSDRPSPGPLGPNQGVGDTPSISWTPVPAIRHNATSATDIQSSILEMDYLATDFSGVSNGLFRGRPAKLRVQVQNPSRSVRKTGMLGRKTWRSGQIPRLDFCPKRPDFRTTRADFRTAAAKNRTEWPILAAFRVCLDFGLKEDFGPRVFRSPRPPEPRRGLDSGNLQVAASVTGGT